MKEFWTPEDDAELIRARKVMSVAQVAEHMTRFRGVLVTADSVIKRVGRLRAAGQIPRVPWMTDRTGSAGSRDPRAPVDVAAFVEDDEVDPDTLPGVRREDLGSSPPRHDTDPAGMPAVAPEDERAEQEAEALSRLLDHTRRAPVTLEELCDVLDMTPGGVRRLVAVAQERGYRVELDDGHVGRPPHDVRAPQTHDVLVEGARDRHVIAAVGDIHFGSRHHLGPQFHDYCRNAYEQGARTFLHVGDLLDGVYRHSIWEQSHRGYEEQVACAIECLPRMPGATWYFIQGNHDETLGEASGLEVGRAIEQSFTAAGRNDLKYLGPRAAYVRLVGPGERRGIFVELWHPRDKGNAYAKSYRMQKHIENYAPGQKPDVLFAGHWHQQFYFTTRGVHAFSAGCWQGGQSSFGKSLGGAPAIGSWIVEYAVTDSGTIRHIRPEWCGYFETESVRDVELG